MERIEVTAERLWNSLTGLREQILHTYIADENEVLRRPDGQGVHWLDTATTSGFLRLFVALCSHTADPNDQAFARRCLQHLRNGAVFHNGVWFWDLPTPSICSHGRYWYDMFIAAQAFEDLETLDWIRQMIRAWPFLHGEHLFAVHFSPVTLKETAHNHPYNMELEAAVPAWLVGKETGDEMLMNKGRDVVEHVFLPNQREDGLWDYDYEKIYGTEAMEYLYSGYCLLLAARLLPYEEWTHALRTPLSRSLDRILQDCLRRDGSIYTPTHWGWGHIWESTAMICCAAWYLTKYGGGAYEEIIARGIDWVLRYRLFEESFEPSEGDMGTVAKHLAELLYQNVQVEGPASEVSDVLDTLTQVVQHVEEGDRASIHYPECGTRARALIERLMNSQSMWEFT